MYTNYYRVVDWDPLINLLEQSIYAEEMVCSMSSELYHIPQTMNLQGLNEMHEHLIQASYHRVSAAGSARRLKMGEQQTLIDTLVACILNAERQDQQVWSGLLVIESAASAEFKPFIQLIIQWQGQAERSLNQAKQYVSNVGITIPSNVALQSGEY